MRGAADAAPLCHEQEVEMDESTWVSRHLDSKGQALLWALFPMVPGAWDFSCIFTGDMFIVYVI